MCQRPTGYAGSRGRSAPGAGWGGPGACLGPACRRRPRWPAVSRAHGQLLEIGQVTRQLYNASKIDLICAQQQTALVTVQSVRSTHKIRQNLREA